MLPITPRKLEYFTVIKNPDRARALFKESVGRVGISISSYCNRQCTYCPNSIVDRKSAQNFMSDDLFFSIMRQLSKIDYDGEINVTRYNEPLADKEYALSRLRDIRVFLPDATIHIFTNGDYLDRPYLDELAGLGVNRITATVHAGPGGKTDIDSLTTEQDRRLRELDLPYTLGNQTREDRYRIATVPVGEHLVLDYVAHDFYRGAEKGNAWAFDRGGVLPIPKTVTRISPCFSQFSEIDIEWDGKLLPCCQIHNDAFENDKYVLGTLMPDSNLFLAWTGSSYVQWRVKMFTFTKKATPCMTCSYGIPEGDTTGLRKDAEHIRTLLFQVTGQAAI